MRVNDKFWLVAVLAMAFGFGLGFGGRMVADWRNTETAVIRIGNARTEVDYDLAVATEYLAYRLERDGYRVLGTAYKGELYPAAFDGAGVNVFVRGFLPFYDARMNEVGKNLFYMHRAGEFYEEELRGYDAYIFSQKTVYDKKKTDIQAVFFGGGAVPHKRLEPAYENDVLYIYEDDQENFAGLLKHNLKAETFGAVEFAMLSTAEREAALKKARVVVYNMMPDGDDADYDEHYVPYAAYDIMGYGRPLVTNRRAGLENEFGGLVWLYDEGGESRIQALQEAFAVGNDVREQLAGGAREILLAKERAKDKIKW